MLLVILAVENHQGGLFHHFQIGHPLIPVGAVKPHAVDQWINRLPTQSNQPRHSDNPASSEALEEVEHREIDLPHLRAAVSVTLRQS